MANSIIGIDLGKEGALVQIDYTGALIRAWHMPMFGRDYDALAIRNLFIEQAPKLVVIERAQQFKGRGNSSSVAHAQGLIEGICTACWPVALVAAVTWQAKMLQGTKREKITRMVKSRKTGELKPVDRSNTKERVQKIIDTRWPGVVLETEGMRDAFLIAQFGRTL